MKHLLIVGLVGLIAAGFAARAWAADEVPWKTGEPAKTEGKPEEGKTPSTEGNAATANVDLKTALTPIQYSRAIKPIEVQLEEAEKIMKQLEKAKAEPMQNPKQLIAIKATAARFYMAAALKAKAAINMLKDEEHKQAVATQYEKPSIAKMADLYNDLAQEAMMEKDFRSAISLYAQVLKIDPENAMAKAGIEAVQKAAEQEAEAKRLADEAEKERRKAERKQERKAARH
jgi:tetratricopeptide (TPR) repeat protein